MAPARNLVIFFLFHLSASAFQLPLSGRVQNSVTGEPISGASVTLACTKAPQCGQTSRTNSDGLFSFPDAEPGTYILLPSAKQFSNAAKAMPITVEANKQVSFTTLTLDPNASVSGKVVNDAGISQTGITVSAWLMNHAGGHTVLYKSATTQTDQNGRYTLTNLTGASYYITAELPPQTYASRRNFIFFPDALNPDLATPLKAASGTSANDINFKLHAVEAHRISGRVSGLQDSYDPKTIQLSLEPVSTIRAPALFQPIALKPDGSFFQDAVLPGSYVMRLRSSISAPASDGKEESFTVHQLAAFNLEVGHTNVTGIEVAVVPPVHLSGRVLVPQMMQPSKVKITLRPAAYEASSEMKRATVASDGTITFPTCDATKYSVHVATPSGTYVSAIDLNRQDALSHLIDLSSGAGGELTIKVASGSADLTARIHADSSETPPPEATQRILLIPGNWNPEVNGSVPSCVAKDGACMFKNQAPGVYAAVAGEWSEITWRRRQEPELIRYLQSKGRTFEIMVGGHQQIDVTLLRESEIAQVETSLGLN